MFRKKTRGELMRTELGTSWEHLLQAATHAASGVGAKVGPQAGKVRGVAKTGWDSTVSAFIPLADAYRAGVSDAATKGKAIKLKAQNKKGNGQMSRKKVGMLIGMLAAGAAVGAAGALVMRRRKRQQWSEFDPSGGPESIKSDAKALLDDVKPKSSTLDKASSHASKAMHKTADKLHSAASSLDKNKSSLDSPLDEAAERINDATDDLVSKASNVNGRFKP